MKSRWIGPWARARVALTFVSVPSSPRSSASALRTPDGYAARDRPRRPRAARSSGRSGSASDPAAMAAEIPHLGHAGYPEAGAALGRLEPRSDAAGSIPLVAHRRIDVVGGELGERERHEGHPDDAGGAPERRRSRAHRSSPAIEPRLDVAEGFAAHSSTTTLNTELSRPRRSSGVTVSVIVERHTALMPSAQPAAIEQERGRPERAHESGADDRDAPRARQRSRCVPKPAGVARNTSTEVSTATVPPAAIAAYRSPVPPAPAWYTVSDRTANSASRHAERHRVDVDRERAGQRPVGARRIGGPPRSRGRPGGA